ncbi:MAG: adenylosuccinate lyase [Nitrospirota bacterium]
MIERYCRPKMSALWEPKSRYAVWLKVELLVCEALVKAGTIPDAAYKTIRSKAKIKISRIDALEKVVKHDVIAFLSSITEQVGESGRYLHWGMTSSDLVDTSLAVLLQKASDILIEDMTALMKVLKDQALRHKNTVMMGRSHGMHGEPITFGLKMALWHEEMRRNLTRLVTARDTISFGKISGSMGTYAHLSPAIEDDVMQHLSLMAEPIANQIVQRDRHAHYMQTLALIAASLEKFATEIRHLQRTEVMEAEEPFTVGQKGSSSMPHKRNPIGCENICGLSRVIRAHAMTALENVTLWHERDMSHSGPERIILPDATILLDFMLDRFTTIMENLAIYPKRMIRNMDKSGGIVFSQKVLLLLIEKGVKREEAYKVIQEIASKVLERDGSFKKETLSNPFILSKLTKDEILSCFDPKGYLKEVDTIYKRLDL